jgi:hypothetical protein
VTERHTLAFIREKNQNYGRRKQSSGIWHRVDVVLTNVSEERIAPIFRVEGKIRKSASEETVRTGTSRLLRKS